MNASGSDPTLVTDTAAHPTPVTDTDWIRETACAGIGHLYIQEETMVAEASSFRKRRNFSLEEGRRKKWTRQATLKQGHHGNKRKKRQKSKKEAVTTWSLLLGELQDMQKDFSHCPGKHNVTWLLWCWDNRASTLDLLGSKTKQLGSLSREGGIDIVQGTSLDN